MGMRKDTLSPWWFIACLPEVDLTQTFCICSGIGVRFGLVYRNVVMTYAKVF